MSTTSNVLAQLYERDGAPIPPNAIRERLVNLTSAAYERRGTFLDCDVVDLHLLETADKAACSLLRDQWTDGFPVAAYSELLTTIAALRSVLRYSPTPKAIDVNAWARGVREASAVKAGDDRDFHEVRIVVGPYQGALLRVWGAGTPQAPDTVPGSFPSLTLPTERGDSTDIEFGTVYNRCLNQPHPRTGQWEYMLDRDHSLPGGGSRPRLLPGPTSTEEGQ
ncbi:hypothetical protein [Streptomyces sp. NPDC006551]|uniref:hypothetical protein n=1 Tax=Streptomyces sp. NPDC006551 TaxID=3157178 RepID=UPI00339F1634